MEFITPCQIIQQQSAEPTIQPSFLTQMDPTFHRLCPGASNSRSEPPVTIWVLESSSLTPKNLNGAHWCLSKTKCQINPLLFYLELSLSLGYISAAPLKTEAQINSHHANGLHYAGENLQPKTWDCFRKSPKHAFLMFPHPIALIQTTFVNFTRWG